jgi:hypothetical protein
MPALTVAETLILGLPASRRPHIRTLQVWVEEDLGFGTKDRVASVNPELRFNVQIAQALACDPEILVLDEPAAPQIGEVATFASGESRLVERPSYTFPSASAKYARLPAVSACCAMANCKEPTSLEASDRLQLFPPAFTCAVAISVASSASLPELAIATAIRLRRGFEGMQC